MIYFTSDTHFNHANIIKYCARPWADAADTVYFLGDFVFGRDCAAILQQLNGSWHLIPGNHDPSSTRRSQGWADVHVADGIKLDEFWLRHHPVQPKWGKLLHGHTHSPPERRQTKSYALDVGVDAWDYRPVSIDRVRADFKGRP